MHCWRSESGEWRNEHEAQPQSETRGKQGRRGVLGCPLREVEQWRSKAPPVNRMVAAVRRWSNKEATRGMQTKKAVVIIARLKPGWMPLPRGVALVMALSSALMKYATA